MMKLDCAMQSPECSMPDISDSESIVIADGGKYADCILIASHVCRQTTCKEPEVPGNKTQASSQTRLSTMRSRVPKLPIFGLVVMILACSRLILSCSEATDQQWGQVVQVRSGRSIQQGQQETGPNEAIDNDQLDGHYSESSSLDGEQEQILAMLRNYYNLNTTQSNEFVAPKSIDNSSSSNQTGDKVDSQPGDGKGSADGVKRRILPHLPAPSNLSVLIISWYPPILKLSWNLDEFGGQLATTATAAATLLSPSSSEKHWHDNSGGNHSNDNQSNLYRAATTISSENKSSALETNNTPPLSPAVTLPRSNDNDDNQPAAATATSNEAAAQHEPGGADFDLELALEEANRGGGENSSSHYGTGAELMLASRLRELSLRRYLVEKALTCFQVTYNVVDSRFKVIEEFPPYLRSILLERLQPATKYNLRVAAVYLNGRFRRVSQRVQFISPTDNESRRFKENTYRPIHSYPDEPRELKIGLSQVRCEELALVGIALLAWVGCICLFFKKWGKIRMLEPYQPAYREQLDVGVAVGGPSSTPPQMQLGSISTGAATPTIGGLPALSPSNSSLQLNKQHNQLLGTAKQPTASTTPKGGATSPTTVQTTGPSSPVTPLNGGGCVGKRQSESCGAVGTGPIGRRPTGTSGALLTSRTSAATANNHLNYLFQSKAQALAKATLMWPTLAADHHKPRAAPLGGVGDQFQAGQKFRQEQYRTKFGASVTSATSELETLRRLGECLAARRHWNRLTGAGGPSGISATGTPLTVQLGGGGPLERMTTKHSSCDSSLIVADPHHRKLLLATTGHHNSHHNQHHHQQATRTGSNRSSSTVREQAAGSLDSAQRQHEDVFGKLTAELGERSLRYAGFSPQSSGIFRQGRRASQSVAHETERGESGTAATVSQHKEQQRTVSSASASRSQLMMSRFVRRNPAVDYTNMSHRESLRMATQSLDQSTSESMAQLEASSAGGHHSGLQEQVSAESQQQVSSNRLRRLQFVSKVHQHHHIAQSMSTSTLVQHQQRYTFESSSKANSLSLDSREHQSHEQTPPDHSDNEELQQQLQPARRQSQQSHHLHGSKPSSLDLNSRQQQQSLIKHHILIEPPSPPNNKQLISLLAVKGNQNSEPAEDETREGGRMQQSGRAEKSFGQCSETVSISVRDQDQPTSFETCALSSSDQSDDQHSEDLQESALKLRGDGGRVTRLASASSDSRLAAHLQRTSQPEICLDNSPLEPDCQLEAGGQVRDHDGQPVQPLPGSSGRRTPPDLNAFQRLANSYRASTERRLSRLAYAQSSGQLSSQASCWFCSSPDCGGGVGTQRWAARMGPGGGSVSGVPDGCQQRNQSLCLGCGKQATNLGQTAGQPPARLYSMCATDEHFLRPESTTAATPSATRGLVSSSSRNSLNIYTSQSPQQQQQQQQQTLTLTRRARRCSYCNSIECANQQACLAISQIRALQLHQQQRIGHRAGHGALSSAVTGATFPNKRDWPSPAPTVPTRKDTIQVRADELDYGGGDGSEGGHRARVSSVFACSPFARGHRRDSFVMLRALSQKKSKSAEDIAYLSSLVLQIWQREPNPLLQNVSQLQQATRTGQDHHHRHLHHDQPVKVSARRKSSSNLQAQAGGDSCGSRSGLKHVGSDVAPQRRRQSTGQGLEFAAGSFGSVASGPQQQRHSLGQSKRRRPKSSMTIATDQQ